MGFWSSLFVTEDEVVDWAVDSLMNGDGSPVSGGSSGPMTGFSCDDRDRLAGELVGLVDSVASSLPVEVIVAVWGLVDTALSVDVSHPSVSVEDAFLVEKTLSEYAPMAVRSCGVDGWDPVSDVERMTRELLRVREGSREVQRLEARVSQNFIRERFGGDLC